MMTKPHAERGRACHRCEHNGKRHTACLTCKGISETSYHAPNEVRFVEGMHSHHLPEAAKDALIERLGTEGRNMAAKIVDTIMNNKPDDLWILASCYQHRTTKQIARTLGITTHAAETRIRTAKARSKIVAAYLGT